MFIVLIEYVAPIERIDALMSRHVAFLEPHLRTGMFVAAGRRNPRTGGVVLARAESREELTALMADDPFVAEGAATFEILEFRTSLHAACFKEMADPRTRTIR